VDLRDHEGDKALASDPPATPRWLYRLGALVPDSASSKTPVSVRNQLDVERRLTAELPFGVERDPPVSSVAAIGKSI
jgi:hypothetical protein